MRKLILILLLIGLIILGLNFNVTTDQCINYRCKAIGIPLWIKVIEFCDRDYHYRKLAKEIIKNTPDNQERAMKILEWVQENIRRMPEGFSVVDDHVWHIIIRGYGADDQFQDVFATLCNYVGLDAFFSLIISNIDSKGKSLSFVRIKSGWSVFDAYNGVYFRNRKGEIANVDDLAIGNWQVFNVSDKKITEDYGGYFKNLMAIDYENWKSSRPAIQSPLNRFFFWRKSNTNKYERQKGI